MLAVASVLPIWALEVSAIAAAVSVVVNAISGVLSDWLDWKRIRQMDRQQQQTHELTKRIATHVGLSDEELAGPGAQERWPP